MRSPLNCLGSLNLVLVAVAVPLALSAQSTTGRILGGIRDPSGASLDGATITIMDVQRGTTRSATTDNSGSYAFPNLIPGVYTLRVEAAGFKTVERPDIRIEVASELTIDLSLTPGDVKETVTVAGVVPLIDAASATWAAR